MLAPRWVGFLAAFVALVALYLLWASIAADWHGPRTEEASEALQYYFWIMWSAIVGGVVVTLVGFPSAIVADRLFQVRWRSRSAPYLLFATLAVILTGSLFAVLQGEVHPADALALLYFFASQWIVWKVSYEMPKHREA